MDKRLMLVRGSASLADISDATSQVPPMAWREQHEEILRKWKARCFVNLWLCVASGYYYTVLHNWLSYPVIIMSSISSATLFSYDAQIVKVILGIITLACCIITCTMRHLKPGELYQSHSSFAKRYVNLIRTIDTCLSLTNTMRPAPDIFLERIGNEIDVLESTQLDPPLLVIRKFEQKYGAVHRILYGDDIVELMKIELQANTLYKRIKSSTGQRLSDVSSSEAATSSPRKFERLHRATGHTSLRGGSDKDTGSVLIPDSGNITKQQTRFDLDSFTDDIAMDISRYPGDVLCKNPEAPPKQPLQ